LDKPASAVTIVSPQPGTQIDPGSQVVTVTTNPDSMPQPTQRETDLAAALENQSPTVDDTNKLDIARACLELEDAGTGNTDTAEDGGDISFNNCQTLPIFVSGNDVRAATDHDLAALGAISDPNNQGQAVNPAWVELNYRPASDNPSSPSWKNSVAPCNTTTPPGDNCDEYPFFASLQGGGQASPLPNLKYIDGAQNQLQGSRYSAFLSACAVAPGAPFLVIPLPAGVAVNTLSICT
jgi:hypothetical protein